MAENTSLSLYHVWDEGEGDVQSSVSYNLEARGYGSEVVVRLTYTRTSPGPTKDDVNRTVERYEMGGLQLAELIREHATKLSGTPE